MIRKSFFLILLFLIALPCFAARIAYIADYDSLQIVDVTNPLSPFRLGACDMPLHCWDVAVQDTFAYVACQSSFGLDGRLVRINVADPESPFVVDQVFMNGDPIAVYISGYFAYVAAADYYEWQKDGKRQVAGLRDDPFTQPDVEGGVRIVRITPPDSFELVLTYETPGDPRDIFVVGNLVYVADYDSLVILRHKGAGIEETEISQISEVRLFQNYPNPFRQTTVIRYSLPAEAWQAGCSCPSEVSLKIYDVIGRLVRTFHHLTNQPFNQITWDGRDDSGKNVTNGVYFYRLATGSQTLTKKMLLIR